VPSFIFIFLGAPYVERLRGNQAISAALTGITAAVVGVIANLASTSPSTRCSRPATDRTWGPVHLELPDLTSLRPVSLAIAVTAAVMIFKLRWSVLRTLGVCAALGLAAGAATLS
jgi:chromate transporter